ncbi:M3 family oligoendopeptidase [Bdellovibrio reynosensis]|uniref:M3 family oligoendopeptidase n=1 Tax=Bdellovibrio reynosensis TaxID=2835041 RepID=A0ABY4CDR1_9BACT|nr:M3 family oligoendopeptidase [Bdellovibrio reynosensis]UOF02973.1 M3 family oligoendopeptidase [Bdellovibrio reynosensis]
MEKMAWNIESEYPSYNSSEFAADFELVSQKVALLEKRVAQISSELSSTLDNGKDLSGALVDQLQAIVIDAEEAGVLAWNMGTYLNCVLSVDSTDEGAKAKRSELSALSSRSSQAFVPVDNFIIRCSEKTLMALLAHPLVAPSEFLWRHSRKLRETVLSNNEEALLEAVSTPGLRAWGELYTTLSGTMKCHMKFADRTETVGLAHASALIRNQDPEVRRVAWESIQEAWNGQKETAASILNSISGWRHEVNKKRSYSKQVHFLDTALQQTRIEKDTLEAMLTACYDNVHESRKAATLMAKVMGKSALDPWDLLAQSPVSGGKKERSYDEALVLIENSFRQIDPKMGEFVKMMADNRWIEARVLPTKRNGAYCTGFPKKREPRVFMTFMGSNSDISTLAHELGHAFHSWVMRDLPRKQTYYPMTLAETASIFAEAVLHDVLIEEASTKEEKIEFAWGEIEGATSFLLNIPARFDFEKSFYEQRAKRALSADELSKLTDDAWTKWYGPTLSQNDKMFWASKLHFAMAGTSFYNFPYTFGYLFSMSIYARRKDLGANFMQTYIDILRDTGRMSAEDLVQKHLGEDIRKPEFWKKSIQVINQKVNAFEKLAF